MGRWGVGAFEAFEVWGVNTFGTKAQAQITIDSLDPALFATYVGVKQPYFVSRPGDSVLPFRAR